MRTTWLVLVLVSVALSARAAATATKTGDLIVMQNETVKLTIDLEHGARVSEFVYRSFGENLIYPTGGLLMDHVWEQTWPGEFLARHYEGEVVQAGPAEAVVKVWTTGTGDTIHGLRFERQLTLRAGERAVRVKVALANSTTAGRITGYWNQNCYWFGGRKEGMTWARPGVRGIDRMGLDAKGEQWLSGAWYYIEGTAGWSGGFNKDQKQGMLFLCDYNDLWQLYDNAVAVTTEWMYDRVAIPAGKTWTTEIAVLPVAGVTGFTHGSRYCVANFEVTPIPTGLKIEHQVAKGLVPLRDVTLHTKIWGLKKAWTARVDDVKFAELRDDAQQAAVTATGVETPPAGIEVTLTGTRPDGETVTETYGDYYGAGEANNDPFTMKPYLAFPRPAKNKVFLKPDVIAYHPNADPRIGYLRGLWTQFFRVDEAIQTALPHATITDGWLDGSPVGLSLSWFPADYPTLLSHDLIVLGNVPAAPFGLVGQEMIADYLDAGGNVLLLGGDQAFGQAGFSNARLLKQIPVELGGVYNWRRIPGGGALQVVGANPITAGVTFRARDKVYYSHLCTAKPGSAVLVTAGDRPILVVATTPKGGHIACVLATPFGEAGPGETAFWDAPAWNKLMANTIRWLTAR